MKNLMYINVTRFPSFEFMKTFFCEHQIYGSQFSSSEVDFRIFERNFFFFPVT
jgi:hypothetical protein